uniref:Uncharacterized protein n=1 Tax=Timema genevievae TaxID=629358 RepID=A0A7R9K5R7_TIMGE|nr:unnamed protein product [Timema genevievae]
MWPPEDHASFERSSHFYERREGDAYLRRGPAPAYHVTAPDPLRGRTRDRLYRNGPYSQLIESYVRSWCAGVKKELLATSTKQRCETCLIFEGRLTKHINKKMATLFSNGNHAVPSEMISSVTWFA